MELKFPLDPVARGEVARLAETMERGGHVVRDLLARVQHLERRIQSVMCSFCGLEFARDDGLLASITEHMQRCPRHPLQDVRSLQVDLGAAAQEAVDVLTDLAADDVIHHRRMGFWEIAGGKGREVIDRLQGLLARLDDSGQRPAVPAMSNGHASNGAG